MMITTFSRDWLIAAILGLIHGFLATVVYRYVPKPYMDEIFHIRQTRKYCKGDWSWDPMITTPPALYLLALPFCGMERYLNSILIGLTFVGFCRFRRLFVNETIHLSALVTIIFPVLFQTSLLFYTDLLSVCTVIWGFSLSSPLLSSLMFAIATLTRQTNIVWAALKAGVRLLEDIDVSRPFISIFQSLLKLAPLILLAGLFCLFVLINEGIVLGDASAHNPRLHLVQFLYLVLFLTMHSWPHSIHRFRELLSRTFSPLSLILVIPITLSAQFFAYDHPYLLADNRHVAFYLWRWWLSHTQCRLLLTPLFICSFIYIRELSSHLTPLVRILFTLCSFAVTVPAHLIEPRYFIMPFVLWRLSARTPNRLLVLAELLQEIFVFAFMFFLFIFKPFEWSNEPGVDQRFMW
ncbi:DIE2/ALG10 family protein [Dictyocaulus viviparus]|uniref:Dol-P-Glc:Glc(2)Man(9)GlcNAc(2)-PP-Dol alpha-1,2-glucosyltransferase n=1 Tax=Dictyocaulus viviparus TaxID=29172 RepID=A0A0D8Y2J6_DICVI|nr:DIE2/ALG10 family protein [Dictyocaulus viviparus]